MDIKLYALIKNMVKGITKGDKGDKGDVGLSKIIKVNAPSEGFTLYNNGEYHITGASGALVLDLDFDKMTDLTPSNPELSGQITVIFDVNENMSSISFPEEIKWAVAKPVWVYGKTYMISFVPCGERVIAAWAVV